MKVVAFTKTDASGPSSRYRYYGYRDLLRDHGIELVPSPLFGRLWFAILAIRFKPLRVLAQVLYTVARFARRSFALATLGRPELVVIEHQLFPYLPPIAERWLARRGIPFTIEFDDAIYRTAGHEAKLAELCRLARRAVVGNRFLAEFVAREGGVPEIVPTTLDLTRYTPTPARRRDTRRPFVIGWIGLPYNFGALATLTAPLARLATTRPLELRVISRGAPAMPGVPVREVPWSEAQEVTAIAELDCGVMPLLDDEWSRGKCALKILQYFAAGVPVVASPVGVNADIVRDGANGLLARDEKEWYEAVARLAADPEFAARLSTAGRKTVEEGFDRTAWAPRLAAIWRAAAART